MTATTEEFVSRTELDTIIRSAVDQAVSQVLKQVSQEGQQVDQTRQIADTILPSPDESVNQEDNDEKSPTEARIQTTKLGSIEQRGDMREKLNASFASFYHQSLDAAAHAQRLWIERSLTTSTEHAKRLIERDPAETSSTVK